MRFLRLVLKTLHFVICVILSVVTTLFVVLVVRMDIAPEWSRDFDATESIVVSLVTGILVTLTFLAWLPFFKKRSVA